MVILVGREGMVNSVCRTNTYRDKAKPIPDFIE